MICEGGACEARYEDDGKLMLNNVMSAAVARQQWVMERERNSARILPAGKILARRYDAMNAHKIF